MWPDWHDAVLVCGLAATCGGLWMIWEPLALVAAGAVILWMALPPRGPFIR